MRVQVVLSESEVSVVFAAVGSEDGILEYAFDKGERCFARLF